MRPKFAALTLAFGVIGIADFAFGSIYVPGQIRDGIYIRPHFVSAPKVEYRAWPPERPAVTPGAKPQVPPLDLVPKAKPKLGQAS